MKTATFENTVDILVKAYLNGTLLHSNCHACAVGNIVADCMGERVDKNRMMWEKNTPMWDDVFCVDYIDYKTGIRSQSLYPQNYHGSSKIQIDSTGYTWQQLSQIEKAFETAPCQRNAKSYDEEWMFNGLMAVVDVLAEIHNVDLSTRESAKAMFVKETTH